jgi:Zn-dependent M28 family amino/carboxypeptidase
MTRRRRLLLMPIGAVCAYLAVTSLGRSAPDAPDAPDAPITWVPPAAASVLPDSLGWPRADELMTHVRALSADSMEGRLIGSAGSARARAYIVRTFEAAGLERLGASYEHPFETQKMHIQPPLGPGQVTYHGVNLVGLVRGRTLPGRYIVVSAHYDHLGAPKGEIYNGADDNASGTAALPVLAEYFRQHPPEHSLLFVALDGEERGLLGAKALLEAPPVPADSMVLDVNMDMIGRNAAGELYAAGTRHYPQLRPALDSVAARSPIHLRFGHDGPSLRPDDDWTSASDHGAFHDRHIPFVYFGEEDHADYHQPSDDADRLMPAFYAGAVATVRDAIESLDRALVGAR